jgi:endonuclease G, mitochondrial
MKSLQMLGILLFGLIYIATTYLISTYWANFEIVSVSIIAYASFISLVLLNDKTRIFKDSFDWIWAKLFMSFNRLILVNVSFLIILIALCWISYGKYQKNYNNALVKVYENNKANVKVDEKVDLYNLMTKEKLSVTTDEFGVGRIHVDIPSTWQKTYKNYRFPEETVEKSQHMFSINLADIDNVAEKIQNISDSSIQKIGIWQMPTVSVKRGSAIVLGADKIKSDNYLMAGISNINSFVQRNGFIINYNTLLKVPNCVAYRTFRTTNIFPREYDQFYRDVELESPSGNAYKGSGYDRGNLVRRSDMFCHGENAVKNAYLTSAIVPQAPKMNRGIWLKLEEYTSKFAFDTVYVIAGALFLKNDSKGNTLCSIIGDEKVAVPSHLYRIISRKVNGRIESLAFIIPNSNDIDDDFKKYLVAIKDIENELGIVFFSDLPVSQQAFKMNKATSVW